MSALIIAECGSCHDGRLDKAKRLIEEAAASGCSVAKFQVWSDPNRLADQREIPPCLCGGAQDWMSARYLDDTGEHLCYRCIYRLGQLPVEWLPQLRAHCDLLGIQFACSTYLPEDVAVVAPFVHYFKISSFEARATDLRNAHLKFSQPLLISLGMCQLREMYAIRAWALRQEFEHNRSVWLLHCVSGYPTPIEQAHLKVIAHNRLEGFSDHTGRMETGAWAVAVGATIVEVHLRLPDTDISNPDAGLHALDPVSLRFYVSQIRRVEVALGTCEKTVQPCEAAMRRYQVVS